ncbi:hypothetical protein DEHRE_11590 [Dehalobacter restrictus DSM 9455]|uniref:Uncharacterized protein n=1 Tax=Dehalobacter restrictus (strain DSM 9455 / PER-K23) TaxID=871738 RepID=A0ABM5PAV3_DEHRP|nr:hypothetical protein DEHRE_11590 [Dehalobacter restrictus DSM 9455]
MLVKKQKTYSDKITEMVSGPAWKQNQERSARMRNE